MTLPALRCTKLIRFLGNEENMVQALKGVSFDAHLGHTYSIVGPSGCGKSTLLYLLGLLDKPDSGEIHIGDVNASGLNDDQATNLRNQLLGFVFQFHFLIKEFTALDNVTLPMKKLGVRSEEEQNEIASGLLKAVGLGDKTHRLASHLSGGEQQRVAIARALANTPKVILADEPTGNLDSANSSKVFDLLTKIVHEENLTLVVVTHNPEVAKASDVTLTMRDGEFVDRSGAD